MTFPRRLATTALVVVVTVAMLYAVMVAGGSGWFDNMAVRVLYDAATLAVLIPWLAISVVRPAWFPRSRMVVAIIGCLAAFAVSTATSRLPRMSLEMFAYAALLAELYLLLVQLLRLPTVRRHLERMALVLALDVAALYLIGSLGAWIDWWSAIGRFAIPPLRPSDLGVSVGSPNPVATLVVALGAVALAVNRGPRVWRRVIGAAVVILVGAATLVSGSRGAWLGAAAGLSVVVVVAPLLIVPVRQRLIRVVRSPRGAALAVVVVAVLGVSAMFAALSGRLSTEGSNFREAFAAASLKMFAASPLTGFGPNTWQVFRAAFTVPTDIDYYVPHAHNLYLMTLAEFGLVGAIAGVIVIASLVALIARALRSGEAVRQRVGAATLFVVVMFAGQQLVDVLVNVPALMVAVALPVAWLDATDQTEPAESVGRSTAAAAHSPFWRVLPPVGLVATCVIAVGLGMIESVTVVSDHAVAAGDAGNWTVATTLAAQATARDPDYNAYWFDLGVSAANAGSLQVAQAALAHSAAADDYTYAWLDLAAVRWRLGNDVGARAALTQAERLGWQRAPVAFAAGWLRDQLGDGAKAVQDYAFALTTSPVLASDPYWSSDGVRTQWPAILQATASRVAGDAALQLDLYAGQTAAAETLATQLGSADHGVYGLVVPAWDGDASARAQLTALAERSPLDPGPVTWCERVALHSGDAASATRFGAWLGVLGAGFSVPRITFGRAQPMPDFGVDRYGALYRRPVTSEMVVSILPQLGIWV